MKKLFNTVQKQIGLLISVVGLSVVVINILNQLAKGLDLYSTLVRVTVWSVFLFTLPFIVSAFYEGRFLKYLQIAIFMIMGTMNVLIARREFYGPSMFLAAWLLMRHYGFLEKHAVFKNGAMLAFFIITSQVSAFIFEDEGIYASISTLLFVLFLILLIIIIWRDMVKQQEQLKLENRALQMNYRKIAGQLHELEEEQQPFDLGKAKISPAEKRIIETLTVYKASNREIAERLNLAESTVKLHLYNIYNKIGVDNRFAIIDLCKYNFTESAEKKTG
jgi:DNA-binding CsgD family transcriptional regulator